MFGRWREGERKSKIPEAARTVSIFLFEALVYPYVALRFNTGQYASIRRAVQLGVKRITYPYRKDTCSADIILRWLLFRTTP